MKQYSWIDAVKEVLKSSADPMHYSDIADAIGERELRSNIGATPHKTVSSIITTSINSDAASPFERVNKGIYRLKATHRELSDLSDNNRLDAEQDDILTAGAIRAFGILWRRDWVDWSSKRLNGAQTNDSDPINFAEQAGVYILYDRDRPIYVGLATADSTFSRLSNHTRGRFSGRWDRFSWFGFRAPNERGRLEPVEYKFDLSAVIEAIEAVLIETLEPPQNRQGGKNFSGVEYQQVMDKEMELKRFRAMIDEHLKPSV